MRLFGLLAQSVEQLAFNQLVVRSNRTRPTISQVHVVSWHIKAPFIGALLFVRYLNLYHNISSHQSAVS